jgi:UDPglucose--hexose-1-phosphate uridylyltransferase
MFVNGESPEIRRCPVTWRRVLFAPGRANRPMNLTHAEPHHRGQDHREVCPFCPGMEHDTTGEIAAIRTPGTAPNGPGWQLRVVPNKFPAALPVEGEDFGIHELIIETDRHITNPTDFTPAEWQRLFAMYRDRVRTLSENPRVQSVNLFKNVGAEAGASLGHTHTQIVALPFVPEVLQREESIAEDRFDKWGKKLLLIELEEALGSGRLITINKHFAVMMPYAPRFPYEMWLMPLKPQKDFHALKDAHIKSLAELFCEVLQALDRTLNFPAYNWFLHTAPVNQFALHDEGFQWHFEILPRTTRPAGLEWSTGCFINAVLPEVAAAKLRENLG